MTNNILKAAALVAFLIFLAVALYVYRPNQNTYTRISVVGDSQTKVSPDTAIVTFSVVTQAKQAVEAQQQNARKSEAVKKAIEATTTDAKSEVKTSDYSLNPQHDYYSGGMPKIMGYEVRNTVTVSVDKLDRVGAIIDAATAAGANSVQGIQYVVSENSPTHGAALAFATQQAMAKAESVAASLGGKIVRVVQTVEAGVPPQLVDADYGNANSAANTMAFLSVDRRPQVRTPVQAGEQVVRSQVVLIVEITV